MESTGLPRRIQLSESSFKCLRDFEGGDGTRFELQQREDSVEAKGKGLLTTYWLLTNASSSDIALDIPSEDGFDSPGFSRHFRDVKSIENLEHNL